MTSKFPGFLVMLLFLSACSQPGSLLGDVIILVAPGHESRPARLSVQAVAATAAFNRDWAAALTAFQGEMEQARQEQVKASQALEEARWTWDQAVAGPRNREKPARMAVRERELHAAENRVAQAKRRTWEVARTHDLRALTVLNLHTEQAVQTDGAGHYVLAGLPAGPAFLYARASAGGRTWIWFCPVRVRAGVQRIDLTDANSGNWPFVP